MSLDPNELLSPLAKLVVQYMSPIPLHVSNVRGRHALRFPFALSSAVLTVWRAK